jgi:hypothetical protein
MVAFIKGAINEILPLPVSNHPCNGCLCIPTYVSNYEEVLPILLNFVEPSRPPGEGLLEVIPKNIQEICTLEL